MCQNVFFRRTNNTQFCVGKFVHLLIYWWPLGLFPSPGYVFIINTHEQTGWVPIFSPLGYISSRTARSYRNLCWAFLGAAPWFPQYSTTLHSQQQVDAGLPIFLVLPHAFASTCLFYDSMCIKWHQVAPGCSLDLLIYSLDNRYPKGWKVVPLCDSHLFP